MRAVGKVVYLPGIRDQVVQAQYFKAPFEQETYLSDNPFLPDVNQEREGHEKIQYKQNLLALDSLALIRFKADITGAMCSLPHCTSESTSNGNGVRWTTSDPMWFHRYSDGFRCALTALFNFPRLPVLVDSSS